MKLFVSLLVLVSCFSVGMLVKRSLHQRMKFYQELLQFLEILKVDISFFQTTMIENMEKYKSQFSGRLSGVIASFGEYLRDNKLEKNINESLRLDFLCAEEKIFVCNIFSFLGSSDALTQCEMIENYKKVTENYVKKYKESFDKHGNLSLKLALSFGLFLIILII